MDRREQDHQWYERFDETRMMFEVENGEGELVEIPAVYEVCGTCDGKGSHVNPSIDSHGLSREDFDEDPDFAEDYFTGRYDVPCAECHGSRVSPTVSDRATPQEKALADELIDGLHAYAVQCDYERRMGC
jgi:hypothetical protein